jgi:hypothetical protein
MGTARRGRIGIAAKEKLFLAMDNSFFANTLYAIKILTFLA